MSRLMQTRVGVLFACVLCVPAARAFSTNSPPPSTLSPIEGLRGACSRQRPLSLPGAACRQAPSGLAVRSLRSAAGGSTPEAESTLLELVQATKGRGQSATAAQLAAIQQAIAELETLGGEQNPVQSPLITGSWELLYTSKSAFDIRNPLGKRVDGSKPGIEGFFGAIFGEDSAATKVMTEAASSSPIQRTVTSIDGVLVSQDIVLGGRDDRVDQRVTLNKDAFLRLSASASTSPESSSVCRASLPARPSRARAHACRLHQLSSGALLTSSSANPFSGSCSLHAQTNGAQTNDLPLTCVQQIV